MRVFLALILISAVAAFGNGEAARAAAAGSTGRDLEIRDVTIVSVEDGKLLPHQTVTIRDGSIVSISNASEQRAPAAEAQTVDGSGKFLIPGLADGHVHIATDRYFREEIKAGNIKLNNPRFDLGPLHSLDARIMRQFLRAGVTTVFTFGSALPNSGDLLELRDLTASGEMLGPRLIVGEMIDGSRKVMLKEVPPETVPSSIDHPQNPEDARLAVLRAKSRGYDFIKAYQHLDRVTYLSVIKTAREQGMRIAGHLPELECAACMTREEPFRTPLDAIAHLEELSRYSKETDLSADDLVYLTGLVKVSGASVVTTLVANRNIIYMYAKRELPPLAQQVTRYVDSLEMRDWQAPDQNYLTERFRNQVGATLFPALYDYQRAIARHLWKKGVPLIAGTDTPIPGLAYGDSLLDELLELNKVGLPPHEALQTATINPFKFFKEADRNGLVKEGYRANLVLLGANPLDYIGNVRRVEGVVVAGRWVPISRLEADMEQDVRYYRTLDAQLGIRVDRH